jgi:hypothetical protein
MDVERQMRAVKRDVVFKRELQLPMERIRDRAQSRPKHSMMHDQKIDIFLCGFR